MPWPKQFVTSQQYTYKQLDSLHIYCYRTCLFHFLESSLTLINCHIIFSRAFHRQPLQESTTRNELQNYKLESDRDLTNSIYLLQLKVCMSYTDVILFYYLFEIRNFHQTLDLFCLSRIVQSHSKETKRIYHKNLNWKTFYSECTFEVHVGLFIV